MRTYVTILAGRTAAEARPVASSSDPEVVEAALDAMRRRATADDPRLRKLTNDGRADSPAARGER